MCYICVNRLRDYVNRCIFLVYVNQFKNKQTKKNQSTIVCADPACRQDLVVLTHFAQRREYRFNPTLRAVSLLKQLKEYKSVN